MLSRKKWIDCMSHEEKCINCLRKADIGRPGAEILTPGGKIKKNPRLSYDISDSGCYAKCVKTCSRKLSNKNSFNKRTSRKKSKRVSRKKSKRTSRKKSNKISRRRSRKARTSSKRTRKLNYNMTFGKTPVFVFGTSQEQPMVFGGSQRTGVVLPGERRDRMIRSLSGEDVCRYFAEAKLPQEVINRLRSEVLTDMKDYLKKKGSFLGFTDYHVWNNVFSDYTLKDFMNEIDKDFLQRAFKLIDKKFLDGIFEKNNIYINVDYQDETPIHWYSRAKATTFPSLYTRHYPASIYFRIRIIADDLLAYMGKISSTGIPETNSLLSYLLVILEHEMVHALIAVFCYKDPYREDTSCYGCWENKIITCPKSGHNKIFMSILNNRFGHSKFAFDPAPPFSDTCFRERIEEEDRYLTEKLAELSTMKESSRFPLLDRLQTYLENVRKLPSVRSSQRVGDTPLSRQHRSSCLCGGRASTSLETGYNPCSKTFVGRTRRAARR